MQLSLIRALLGILLMLFSATMLVPVGFALWYSELTAAVFIESFAITFVTGLILWLPNRSPDGQLRARDGFLITALFWVVLGVFGALPLYLSDALSLSATDAIFESVSGLTTTGATVITGLDNLPKSLLYYRQQLQWLGGIGIIVIAIAILPMLGIGGMQLYRAETPGPMKDNKLTPRITGTAKALFTIYISMTFACALCYWLAGMSPFDALSHSFSTIAIGGFSTHDASMGFFNSSLILWIGIVFMLLAAANFGLHFFAFRDRSLKPYLKDSELHFFYFSTAISTVLVCTILLGRDYIEPFFSHSDLSPERMITPATELFSHGVFQVVSMATTTGFTSTNYSSWPMITVVFMFFLAFLGACAGSTGGGMKAIRVLLILRQGYRELVRLVHCRCRAPLQL